MNPSDAAILLTIAAAHDNRTVGRTNAEAWAAALPDSLDLEEAKQAIHAHYGTSTDWLMPAHITAGVARIRRERIREAGTLSPPEWLLAIEDTDEHTAAYLAWRKKCLADLAAGREPEQGQPVELGAGTGPTPELKALVANLAAGMTTERTTP